MFVLTILEIPERKIKTTSNISVFYVRILFGIYLKILKNYYFIIRTNFHKDSTVGASDLIHFLKFCKFCFGAP